MNAILKKAFTGTSLVVQWLRLPGSNAGMEGAKVQSLVRELRSHMLCGAAKKSKEKTVSVKRSKMRYACIVVCSSQISIWFFFIFSISLLKFHIFLFITIVFFFLINLFIYFWLCWVFLAAHGLSLVAASGGYSSLWCAGFSWRWLLLLWSTGSRCADFSSCGTWAQ